MNGKATCAILKQIRRDIAEKNDIALTIAECTHQGDCPGTCPRCEAEVRILEKALAEKKKKGLKTAVAGISAGLLAVGLSSCTPADRVGAESLFSRIADKLRPHAVDQLDGDIAPPGWESDREPGWEPDREPDWSPDMEEDGGETASADPIAGEIAPADPADGEEFELAGDVEAEDCTSEDAGEDEWVEYAGIMPPEDADPAVPEPAIPDPGENDAP